VKATLLLLPIGVTLAALLLEPRSAFACSVGEDFNPYRDSGVIVGGRITGWEIIPDAIRWEVRKDDPKRYFEPNDNPNYYGPYEPVRFFMDVDRVLKGSASGRLEMVSGNTLSLSPLYDGALEYAWVGSSGACGAFNSDPTGKYAILGLGLDTFGRYTPSLPLTFFIGDEPAGEAYDRALARLYSSAAALPNGGGPPSADSGPSDWALATTFGAGGAALLAASAYLLRRRIMGRDDSIPGP
jgi:hypothetical protein